MPFLCMIYKITNLFKIFLIFSTLIVLISSTFSERRLCGDQKCSVIISRGTTTLRYHAPQEYLSFNVNQPVRILGKSVESNLWYVEITGRRGYVPYTLIREETVLVKKDQLIEVPVVESIDNNQNSSPNHLVLAENIKITDDTDLKSSQIINPDEVVSSTTTSPVAADDNNTDQNIQINVDEKFTDQDKLESENIIFEFDSELKKNGELETAKIYSLENNEENTVNQHYDDHHHHHGLPALFNALPNHNHDIKPKENIDNLPEQTTPSYNNLPLPKNNYDTSTIKPIEQPLKNSGGTENEETSKILPVTPQIETRNELEEILNSEEQSSEIINENENIQDSEQQNPSNKIQRLFRIFLNAVNVNFLTSSSFHINNKKNFDNELDKILYPNKEISSKMDNNETKQTDETDIVVEEGYCENIGPNSCPSTEKLIKSDSSDGNNKNTCNCTSELHFFTSMSDKILEMFDVLVCLAIAAASSILFAFGYYYICNYRKVSALIAKLNIMERKLLVSNTEVEIFKHDLVETRNELSGSNDMVITLKRDLLNSQASTDEELQTQLKEQQKTIEEINISLSEQATNFQNEMQAEKEINENLSQELSKLHLLLSVKEPMWMKQHVFKRISTMHDEGLKSHKNALVVKLETEVIAYLVSFELQIFMNMKSIANALVVVISPILLIIIQLIPIAVRVCRNVRTFMGRQ